MVMVTIINWEGWVYGSSIDWLAGVGTGIGLGGASYEYTGNVVG